MLYAYARLRVKAVKDVRNITESHQKNGNIQHSIKSICRSESMHML